MWGMSTACGATPQLTAPKALIGFSFAFFSFPEKKRRSFLPKRKVRE
jgi:hypothetical protein